MPLSDTARSILTQARQHTLGLAAPPVTLPAAAQHAVLRSLLRQGLVAEYSAPADHSDLGWRQADGTTTAMQITEAGRHAIGYDEPRNAVEQAKLGSPTQAEYETDLDDTNGSVSAAGIVRANALTEPHSESPAAPTASLVGECDSGYQGAGGPSKTPSGATRQLRMREAALAVLAAWDMPEQPKLADAIDALRTVSAPSHPAPRDAAPRAPRPNTKQAAVLSLLRRLEGASGPQLMEATG